MKGPPAPPEFVRCASMHLAKLLDSAGYDVYSWPENVYDQIHYVQSECVIEMASDAYVELSGDDLVIAEAILRRVRRRPKLLAAFESAYRMGGRAALCQLWWPAAGRVAVAWERRARINDRKLFERGKATGECEGDFDESLYGVDRPISWREQPWPRRPAT